MGTREEIVQQVLSLGVEDRVYIANVLEESFNSGDFATPEIEAAWAEEIDRRIAAFDRGDVVATDFETVLLRIRQRLNEHRTGKGSP